ncbi:thiamine diphosphokinase [Granulosicoccus sp. 3-233]|uniref:thiamine diphosphokinase n=1 Tax=Granulosicoccus sp. 3-233 TaxID=3417969 RepID=UPI003D34D173
MSDNAMPEYNDCDRVIEEQARDVARAWVFAGGEFSTEHLPVFAPGAHDRIICVDRGLEHCLAAGLEPSLLIGDFDSVDEKTLNQSRLADIPRHVYPASKAASDLELALQLLAEESLSEVNILGVSGGRTDHMLFNWSLPALRQWPFRLVLLDGTTCCHVLQGRDECQLETRRGQTLSLLAKARSTGVTTQGLRYALEDATLEIGSTLGLSNEIDGEQVRVSISSGTLLVLINRDSAFIED